MTFRTFTLQCSRNPEQIFWRETNLSAEAKHKEMTFIMVVSFLFCIHPGAIITVISKKGFYDTQRDA